MDGLFYLGGGPLGRRAPGHHNLGVDLFNRLGLSGRGRRLFFDHNDLSAFSAFARDAFRSFLIFVLILRTFD
jgi:hypothetical protein